MTEPIRHDWKQIIDDLDAEGITIYKIALMMHRQYIQIIRWRDGSEPKHYDGERLLMIHAEYAPRGTLQTEAPDSPITENSA